MRSLGGHRSTRPRSTRAHRSGKARVALGQGGAHVRGIPSEQLVGALADERELHVPRRPAGEQGRGHPGGIGERLAHDADELRDALLERLRRDGDRGPVEPEVPSDLLGEDSLVVGGLGEAERVGAEPAAGREVLRDRRDEGGIQPPAQEHAALDLGVGLAADGLPEDLVERLDRRDPSRGRRDRPAPVSASGHPVPLDDDHLSRCDLADLGERRLGRREVSEADVAGQGAPVRRELEGGVHSQGRDLGREAHHPVPLAVEQRALPGPVAGQEQPALARIPDRDGEDPGQPLDEAVPQLQVETGNDRDVGGGGDGAPARRQPRPEARVIVDLAVADHHDPAPGVDHRLPAVREAADREPGRPEHRRARLRGGPSRPVPR